MRLFWVAMAILWFVFAALCTSSFGAEYYVDAAFGYVGAASFLSEPSTSPFEVVED